MKKCVIIMNPESGKKKRIHTYQDFYDILRKYGYDTEIVFTKAKGDAEKIVQELDKNIDLVISAGGDGTLNEVVTGNQKRKNKLVIAPLPLGSTNDVGKMYGLGNNTYNNLERLLKGKIKKIDICKMNNKPFIYVACLGEYIDLAYSTPRSWKRKYGAIAYALYGIKHLKNRIHSYKIKYKIDDKEYEGEYSFIFISNSSRIAGQPDVYYDVKLDDNKFEVALANVKTKKDMLRMIFLINAIDVKNIPEVTYYQTDNIEIEFLTKPKTSWCLDGEEYKEDTLKYKFSLEKNMKMLVPKDNLEKLFKE